MVINRHSQWFHGYNRIEEPSEYSIGAAVKILPISFTVSVYYRGTESQLDTNSKIINEAFHSGNTNPTQEAWSVNYRSQGTGISASTYGYKLYVGY